MRKERQAHGWSLAELAQRMGVDAAHLGRVESGKRPPTERLATTCDAAFPERRGWFSDWYAESRTWAEIPAGFRNWSEVEERAASLRAWTPGILDGLLQTAEYARALITAQPAVTGEIISARLANRMERQRRVLMRDTPPAAWFIVDELSLYRRVGSPEVMTSQMRHLLDVVTMPNVRLQVIPAVAHPANASAFIVADDSAWCEHLAGGFVYTGGETVSSLLRVFDSLIVESYRASESAALIQERTQIWASGASPLIRTATAASA